VHLFHRKSTSPICPRTDSPRCTSPSLPHPMRLSRLASDLPREQLSFLPIQAAAICLSLRGPYFFAFALVEGSKTRIHPTERAGFSPLSVNFALFFPFRQDHSISTHPGLPFPPLPESGLRLSLSRCRDPSSSFLGILRSRPSAQKKHLFPVVDANAELFGMPFPASRLSWELLFGMHPIVSSPFLTLRDFLPIHISSSASSSLSTSSPSSSFFPEVIEHSSY